MDGESKSMPREILDPVRRIRAQFEKRVTDSAEPDAAWLTEMTVVRFNLSTLIGCDTLD